METAGYIFPQKSAVLIYGPSVAQKTLCGLNPCTQLQRQLGYIYYSYSTVSHANPTFVL